jgi:predicted Zn-dependent peptidase
MKVLFALILALAAPLVLADKASDCHEGSKFTYSVAKWRDQGATQEQVTEAVEQTIAKDPELFGPHADAMHLIIKVVFESKSSPIALAQYYQEFCDSGEPA